MTQKIYKKLEIKFVYTRAPRPWSRVKNDEKSDILLEDSVQIE